MNKTKGPMKWINKILGMYLGLLVLEVKPSISFLQLSVYSPFLRRPLFCFYTNWKEFLSLHSAIKNQQRMTNFTIRYKKSQRGALKPFPGTFCLAFSSHTKLSKPQFLCLRSHNVCYILVTVLLVEELDTSKFTQQTKKLKTKIKY